jgi:hypothetical protein
MTIKKKEEGKGQTIRVSHCQAHFLRLTALALHDLERNNQGNMWGLVREMGEGAYTPVPTGASTEAVEMFRRVGQYVTGCIPFALAYTNDEGDRIDLIISGGYLGFDAVRSYYLLGVSASAKNISEIPALQSNHLIFLCQIKEINPTNEVSWQHRVPTAGVTFWLERPTEYKRVKADKVISADALALPEEIVTKEGIAVQREIASTQIFGAELAHYSRSYVVTPTIREIIQARAKDSGLYREEVKRNK